MPSEAMTDFGVPVDKNIVEHINRINDIPELKTTYCCSGLAADHDGKKQQGYVVIYTDLYVGSIEENSTRYPHETHDTSLRAYRAADLAGWFVDFTTTTVGGISGMSAIVARTSPSAISLQKRMKSNITEDFVKDKYTSKVAKRTVRKEKKKYFGADTDDSKLYMWDSLVSELEFEFLDTK